MNMQQYHIATCRVGDKRIGIGHSKAALVVMIHIEYYKCFYHLIHIDNFDIFRFIKISKKNFTLEKICIHHIKLSTGIYYNQIITKL